MIFWRISKNIIQIILNSTINNISEIFIDFVIYLKFEIFQICDLKFISNLVLIIWNYIK
jgi:hypothetical protein